MKLYLLEQDYNNDYDTYDSCVVAAVDEEDAKHIHPWWLERYRYNENWLLEKYFCGERATREDDYDTWVWNNLDKIKVTYLWEYILDTQRWVICASFNAG